MLPKRKNTRLKEYDYSLPGAYFVTICTQGRKEILSKIIVGEGLCALPQKKYINKPHNVGGIHECHANGKEGTPPILGK